MQLFFGDQDREFSLGTIKSIGDLEKSCDASIALIFRRVLTEAYYAKDISETIRLAAIGGGLPPIEAASLVTQYVENCPFDREQDPASPRKVALAILNERVWGLSEIKTEETGTPGKQEAAGTDELTSPPSTQ